MARIDEIREFIEKNPSRMAEIMYQVQGAVLARKRYNALVIWTFKDGSYGDVQLRMSDGFNYDKAASIPAYTFNGDGANPNFNLCMSSDGKIFAVVETDVVAEKYKKEIDKKATKGFVGFNLYKNFEDGVEVIYAR